VLKIQAAMPTQATYKVIGSIHSAQNCLNQLATTKISAICKALNYLSNVLEEINAVYLTAIYIPMFPRNSFLASDDTEDNELVQSDGYSLDTTIRWQGEEFDSLPLSQQRPRDCNPLLKQKTILRRTVRLGLTSDIKLKGP
jgi:hypothetical protein